MKYKLIKQFKTIPVGEVFKHNDIVDVWQSEGNYQLLNNTFETLLDTGLFFEVINEGFQNGDTFYYITGAGEIKSKEWTGSEWCLNCQDFLGAFKTEEEALEKKNTLLALMNYNV